MALPKLNDKPKYELTIPSTGKKVKYRPYLVKEEKILMMALESGDKHSALNAVIDTIEACVSDKVDRTQLALFDIEYMFIMIRSKSVGEISEVGIKCASCNAVNEISIQLDNVQVKKPEGSNEIELSDTIMLKMKYPSFSDVASLEGKEISATEKVFELITKCLESVTTEDEYILIKDTPEAEVTEFIESLSSAQFTKVKEFIERIPSVEKEVQFVCKSCSEANKILLRGIDDFF